MAECLEDLKVRREKIVLEYWQLHQFLEEQERHFLAQLDELEKEMQKEQEEVVSQLDGTFSLLSSIISDLEKDCQRPDAEFLQNLKETYTRGEKAILKTVKSPPNMKQAINTISQKSIALRENIRKFKESLAVELKRERTSCQNDLPEEQPDHLQVLRTCEDAQKTSTEESVTLDPHTANTRLLLSPDGKTARHWGYPQALPNNPERFDLEPFVLGCVGFYTGRHSWTVAIEHGQSWAVGVARASVKRKGPLCLSPEQGVWAVEQCWGQFRALTSQWTPLPLAKVPRMIQVCLDCEEAG
uniref:B30.2/SPRY domain-containing protein n=1 Tax=Anolis carolinensis TaxID=28377 RepID=R4GBH5_ANOCA